MRPMLHATMNTTDLLRIAAQFGLLAHELDKAAADAVNDTAKKGRGLTRLRVRRYVTLPTSRVNTAIEISERATPERLQSSIILDKRAKGRLERPSLMSFAGRPKKPPYEGKAYLKRKGKGKRALAPKPFTYQIMKEGSRKILTGAFVARATKQGQRDLPGTAVDLAPGTGNVQAFARKGKARYPLIVPRGVTVAAIWQNPENGVAVDVMKELNDYLPKRIQGQARRIMDSQFKRASA